MKKIWRSLFRTPDKNLYLVNFGGGGGGANLLFLIEPVWVGCLNWPKQCSHLRVSFSASEMSVFIAPASTTFLSNMPQKEAVLLSPPVESPPLLAESELCTTDWTSHRSLCWAASRAVESVNACCLNLTERKRYKLVCRFSPGSRFYERHLRQSKVLWSNFYG